MREKIRVCDWCYEQHTGIHWQRAAESDRCNECRRGFNLLRKRHACHSCGALHCRACVGNEYNVPVNPNEGHVPVCDQCYVALIEHRLLRPDEARAYFRAQLAEQARFEKPPVAHIDAAAFAVPAADVSVADEAALKAYTDLSSVQMSIGDSTAPVAPDWSAQALYPPLDPSSVAMSVAPSQPEPSAPAFAAPTMSMGVAGAGDGDSESLSNVDDVSASIIVDGMMSAGINLDGGAAAMSTGINVDGGAAAMSSGINVDGGGAAMSSGINVDGGAASTPADVPVSMTTSSDAVAPSAPPLDDSE
eukprot:TRINITY_DN836_c0_g1_i1.p2 TRINITY_DN836_c0_g1~~TRINITY_DN836_c0_g1_i1.p2  ORF type:complete len:304 (+),score=153.17 TRINITY_DN836_c0_g1_i1:710-1621(+)